MLWIHAVAYLREVWRFIHPPLSKKMHTSDAGLVTQGTICLRLQEKTFGMHFFPWGHAQAQTHRGGPMKS